MGPAPESGYSQTRRTESPGRTRRWIPLGAVAFLLEIERSHPRLAEIFVVLQRAGQRDPLIAIRISRHIPVFGQHRVGAIGHSVLAQVPRTQMRRDNLQRSGFRGCTSGRGWSFPSGYRFSLPGRRPTWRSLIAKVEQTRLSAGVRLDFERAGVLPGDPQTGGNRHQRGGSIRLALLTGRFVSNRVPIVARLLRFERNWNACVVAFRWRAHAPSPVLRDD